MSQQREHSTLGFACRVVLLLLLPVVAVAAQSAVVRLDDVVVSTQAGATTVLLKTSGPATYRAESLDAPARLVIDLDRTTFAWRATPLAVGTTPLRAVRGSQYRKDVARVVVEFKEKSGYVITEEPEGLTITIPTAVATARPGATPAAGRVAETSAAPAAPSTLSAAVIDERASTPSTSERPTPSTTTTSAPATAAPEPVTAAPGTVTPPPAATATPVTPKPTTIASAPIGAPTPVIIAQAPPPRRPPAPTPAAPATPAPTAGRLISLDFKDADVVNLLRILAAESGKNVVISDDVKGKMSITLRNVPWEQALDIIMEARGLEKVERGNVIRIVTRAQLAREREDAAKFEEARIKAEQVKANAEAEIRSKAAEAAIKEADANQRKLAAEQAIVEQQARGPLREKTIRLAYADPDDIAKTLQGLLGIPAEGMAASPIAGTGGTPPPAGPPFSALYGPQTPGPPPPSPSQEALAKGITIRAHKPTNSIFIRHYEKDLERIEKLIRETLDVQLPQIKIEARLIEVNRTDLLDIGVQWGGGFAGRTGRNVIVGLGEATGPQQTIVSAVPFSGDRTPGINPAANLAIQGFKSPTDTSGNPTLLTTAIPAGAGVSGLPFGNNLVNLPIGGAATGAIGFGIIGPRFTLNLAIQALESQAKARSLSRPEIVTVENAKASISLGSEIPYATVSSAGTQVQFKEAVLKLEVTSTVIREADGTTKVKMKIVVDDNSRGTDVPSGSAGGTLPTINKRHAETEVVVKEGQALVIGGINQRTETETIRKVPIFGDIPVFGWLFKARQRVVDPNRELVVFITPTVLRDAPLGTGPTAPVIR